MAESYFSEIQTHHLRCQQRKAPGVNGVYLKPGRALGFEALSYVSAEGRLASYSKLEFDGFIEQLKNKNLPNSLVEIYE